MKYRLYHGTDEKFDRFDSTHCGKGTGRYYFPAFWFTDKIAATHFFGQNVMVVDVTMHDPLIVDDLNGISPQHWAAKAFEGGHDGLILKDIVDGSTRSNVHAVWDDEQVTIITRFDYDEDKDEIVGLKEFEDAKNIHQRV